MEESDQPYKFLRIFSFLNDLPQAVKIEFIKFLGQTEEYQKNLLVLLSTFLWMLADGKHHVHYALTGRCCGWGTTTNDMVDEYVENDHGDYLPCCLQYIYPMTIVACSFVSLYFVNMHNGGAIENLV